MEEMQIGRESARESAQTTENRAKRTDCGVESTKYEERRPWWQDVASLGGIHSGHKSPRIEGREVKRPGQRGVDRDLIVIVIMLRKKPARGSTRARKNERTKGTDAPTSAWSARVGSSPIVLRPASGRSRIHPHVSGARVHENSMFA